MRLKFGQCPGLNILTVYNQGAVLAKQISPGWSDAKFTRGFFYNLDTLK